MKKGFALILATFAVVMGSTSQRAFGDSPADDAVDQSDAIKEQAAPEWFQHNDPDMQPPAKLSLDVQQECTSKLLQYINDSFDTDFTKDNVLPIQLPGWTKAEQGFVRGGGFNIRVVGEQDAGDKHQVHYGRYMPFIGWVELGAHASLHLPGSINGFQTYTRQLNADGKSTHYDFVAHIDSGMPYEPLGGLIHLFRDVIGASGRNPCPGDE